MLGLLERIHRDQDITQSRVELVLEKSSSQQINDRGLMDICQLDQVVRQRLEREDVLDLYTELMFLGGELFLFTKSMYFERSI